MKQRRNNENKIHDGVNWPPFGGPKHNNQPKTGAAMEGSMEGVCKERDAWGKRDAIILGAL